jgi:D-3-phosphoglycerate dehydrogenase
MTIVSRTETKGSALIEPSFTHRLAIADNWGDIAKPVAAQSILGPHVDVRMLESGISDDQFVEQCADVDILMPMYKLRRLDAALLERLPRLRHIAQPGGSAAHIDIDYFQRRGGTVSLTRSATSRSVSEFVIGALLTGHRRFPDLVASARDGSWVRYSGGHELYGRTLGVVGFGKIGETVAALATGLGMRVLTWSRRPASATLGEWERAENLESLFSQADDVSINVVLDDSTSGLIGIDQLRLMRGGVFINTARAGIVRTHDLLQALEQGYVGTAVIDVHDVEPASPTDPLISHPRVFPTPHVAGATVESHDRYFFSAVTNALEFIQRVDAASE